MQKAGELAVEKAEHGIEIQGPGPTLQRKLFLLGLALLVGVLVYMIPTPEGLSAKGHMYLSLLAGLLVLFLTEPIPLPMVMATSGLGLIILGIDDVKTVWAAMPTLLYFLFLLFNGCHYCRNRGTY
ncbi:hypothetical protein N752_21360 [Desulforamulus aquiferis]|nr:hypothetical protein [Desulforamulus aquiferis]RYD03147.1 hypothetical protein N752_21360 [Desulforamulus aquiferis]